MRRKTPDGTRDVREGDIVVDCEQAHALLQQSGLPLSEEGAAHATSLTRGVLRRIVGRDGRRWNVVQKANASAFVKACRGHIEEIEWVSGSGTDNEHADAAIRSYVQLWTDLNLLSAGTYVPLTLQVQGTDVTFNEVIARLVRERTIQIVGPSGCGKTHLLAHGAITLSKQGYVPVLIRAGYFEGDLDRLIATAIGSATTLEFVELSQICSKAGVAIVLVVDALNECPPALRPELIAQIQTVRIRHNILIFLSGQMETTLPPTIAGTTVTIASLDSTQKQLIVDAHLDGQSSILQTIPEFITSAQDAVVWAAVSAEAGSASTRHGLYAAFARRRLGSSSGASLAYAVLSRLAAEMRTRFISSVPTAALHQTIARTAGSKANDGATLLCISNSGLLPTLEGRVSFRHELLRDFFATERLLAESKTVDELARDLSTPINAELVEFAIAGLSNALDVEIVLSKVRSNPLVSACLLGHCGELPRQTVHDLCAAAMGRLAARFCSLSFEYAAPDKEYRRYLPISVDSSASPALLQQDSLWLSVATAVYDEPLLRNLLELFRRIDAHIEDERDRLRKKNPEVKVAWRAAMFTSIYCMPVPDGLWDVQQMLQAGKVGSLKLRSSDREASVRKALADFQHLSPGQLYFLIQESGVPSDVEELTPPLLFDLAARAWNYGIYHLRLATTHMLTMCVRHFSEAEQKRFTELAESWLSDDAILNSVVIDVLKALGAMDSAFTEEQALEEFNRVLAMDPTQEGAEAAFTIYTHMFDHPYDTAYAQAYYSLSDERRTDLVERAVQTHATDSMFYSFLLSDVLKSPTVRMIPALQGVASKPRAKTSSVQESVSTFSTAVMGLAKLRAPLPSQSGVANIVDRAWSHGANILYHLHTQGTDRAAYEKETEADWDALLKLNAIDVPMRLVRDRWPEDHKNSSLFLEWSSLYLVRLARDMLLNCTEHISLFASVHRSIELSAEQGRFAIEILGLYGDHSDVSVLAMRVDDSHLGTHAIAAARKIAGR